MSCAYAPGVMSRTHGAEQRPGVPPLPRPRAVPRQLHLYRLRIAQYGAGDPFGLVLGLVAGEGEQEAIHPDDLRELGHLVDDLLATADQRIAGPAGDQMPLHGLQRFG